MGKKDMSKYIVAVLKAISSSALLNGCFWFIGQAINRPFERSVLESGSITACLIFLNWFFVRRPNSG